MLRRINKWASPPVYARDDNKTLSANLINLILWILILGSSLYGLVAPIEAEARIRRFLFVIPFVLVMLSAKQILNWGYIQIAGNLVVISLWTLITTALFTGASFQNPAYMGYVVVTVCAGLILSRRATIVWVGLCILTSAAILLLGLRGVLPAYKIPTSPFAFWSAQTVYILVSSILLSETLQKIEEARNRAGQELEERKRVEAKHELVIRELEIKNAELERFTYTVSHDLKSPLITIGGFLGLLEKDMRTNDTVKVSNAIERIREAKDKMSYLLDDLLELSRIGRLKNPSINISLREIVDEVLRLVHGQLTTNNIQVQVQEVLPTIYCDGPRLVEVIQNLVDNAAKFMGKQPNPLIEIGTRNTAEETVIFVKDNGIGIKPVFHERIFSLFDKLEANSEGTGVGLALVKRIIEIHEGRIWVESDGLGNGSTFCFVLPNTKL
jgi:signal transduction histidine kinase